MSVRSFGTYNARIHRISVSRSCSIALVLGASLIFGHDIRASNALAEYDQPWELCALCHSMDGNSHMAKFPKLAGQPAAYIEKQLHDFLQGKRTNDGGQMSAIVTEIDVEDIEKIAYWFATQNPPPAADSDADVTRGQQLYDRRGCEACHQSSDRVDNKHQVPYLTSQHAQYLAKQIKDFQQGNRVHIDDESINDAIAALTEIEIDELVSFLAATARE